MKTTPTTTMELITRIQKANELAMNTWIGTPEELEKRKAYYIENGELADIIHNL